LIVKLLPPTVPVACVGTYFVAPSDDLRTRMVIPPAPDTVLPTTFPDEFVSRPFMMTLESEFFVTYTRAFSIAT